MISKSDRHTEELKPRMLCMKNKGKARKKIGEVPGFGNKYIVFPNKYSGMEEKFTQERSFIERDDHLSKYYEITEEIKVVELLRMVG